MAQGLVHELEVAFNLVHPGAAGDVVQADIITAPLPPDSIGEFAHAPFVSLDQLAAAVADDVFDTFERLFYLTFPEIGAQNENSFVPPHKSSFWIETTSPLTGSKEYNRPIVTCLRLALNKQSLRRSCHHPSVYTAGRRESASRTQKNSCQRLFRLVAPVNDEIAGNTAAQLLSSAPGGPVFVEDQGIAGVFHPLLRHRSE